METSQPSYTIIVHMCTRKCKQFAWYGWHVEQHGRRGLAAAPGSRAGGENSGIRQGARHALSGDQAAWRQRPYPPWFPADAEQKLIFMAFPAWWGE